MKAPFKYSGGKSREAKFIASMLPTGSVQRIVEPFAGSAAMSFFLEKPALVSDTRVDVVHALNAIKDVSLWYSLSQTLEKLKSLSRDELEIEFYRQRDQQWTTKDALERAIRFIVIRQLVFSGMDRINVKTGKENAPFGHYREFKCNASSVHHELMQSWIVKTQSFDKTLQEVTSGDWVFLDPPYLSRNSTYGGEKSNNEEMHEALLSTLDTTNVPWMIVHCSHPRYETFAKNYRVVRRQHKYSQNFKGRDTSKMNTEHLYIMNY